MNPKILDHPLVCICGLGGSGTRVYAEIIKQAGVDIGIDLNPQNDNLLFTRLFKDPIWYESKKKEDFQSRLELFLLLNTGHELIDEQKQSLNLAFQKNHCFKTDAPYNFYNLQRKLSCHYGWKEPNSHIYLKELGDSLPTCKFIYIIRDGPEMSLSKNTQQLKNWGEIIFNLSSKIGPKNIQIQQLKYWFLANQRAIKIGKDYLNGRFLTLNFEDIYTKPMEEIVKILDFLNIKTSEDRLLSLTKIPAKPSTAGRYNQNFLNLNKFALEIINSTNKGYFVSKDNYKHILTIDPNGNEVVPDNIKNNK